MKKALLVVISLVVLSLDSLAASQNKQTSLPDGSVITCRARLVHTLIEAAMIYRGENSYLSKTEIDGYIFDGMCNMNGCDLSIHIPGSQVIPTLNGGYAPQNNNEIGLTIIGQGPDNIASLICGIHKK